MTHSLQIVLLLALVITAAKLAGFLANRIGQPAVFGEILAGLVLGPTVFNMLAWPVFASGPEGGDLLALTRDFAHVGVILLMFIAGLETDVDEMRRVGRVAFWAAFGGVVLPMVGGAATAVAFGLPLWWEGIFIGTVLTATSVSISAQTLMELGALRSREGATILGAAVIDDVMGIVLLSVVVAFATGAATGVDASEIGLVVVRMAAFFGVALVAGRWFMPLLTSASKLGVAQGVLAAALVMTFVYSWAAEYFGGVAAITGAYLSGLLVARTGFKAQVDEGIHALTYSLFVPVFFISIGLQANARELGDRAMFTVVLVVVAIASKAVGCGVFARVSGFNTRQALRVGAGMISRGEVGLIVAGYGLDHNLINRDDFSAAVIMVLVTTMVTPPLLRLTFPKAAGQRIPVEATIAGPPEEADSSEP